MTAITTNPITSISTEMAIVDSFCWLNESQHCPHTTDIVIASTARIKSSLQPPLLSSVNHTFCHQPPPSIDTNNTANNRRSHQHPHHHHPNSHRHLSHQCCSSFDIDSTITTVMDVTTGVLIDIVATAIHHRRYQRCNFSRPLSSS